MTRRRVLWLSGAASTPLLRADDRTEALEAVGPLATALTEGNLEGAEDALPSEPPELRRNIVALMSMAEVSSSVTVVDASAGKAELDWYMRIRSKLTQAVVEERRGRVRLRHDRGRISSLEPVEFFAAPQLSGA